MAWRTVDLNEADAMVVRRQRLEGECRLVRQKCDVLWLLHCGFQQADVGRVTGVSRKTVDRYLRTWQQGGVEALCADKRHRPTFALDEYRDVLRQSFTEQPARSVPEAAERIERLTGVKRSLEAVRTYLHRLGLSWRQVAAVPIPPKKVSTNRWRTSHSFSTRS